MVIYAYLTFPDLLLDAQGISHQDEFIAIHHQGQIMQCSDKAILTGVMPGMTLSMAVTRLVDLSEKLWR